MTRANGMKKSKSYKAVTRKCCHNQDEEVVTGCKINRQIESFIKAVALRF